MKDNSNSPFPNKPQELLLQAALLSGERVLNAWNDWKIEVDFENDVRYASFRTLPLVYNNLFAQGVDDKLMPRLKGIYRQSWSKNHILFHNTGKVLSLLHSEGIKTIVMKGIALSIQVYKNFSVRPMADMDILIPDLQLGKAIDVLKKAGWVLQEEHYLKHNLKYGRSVSFLDSENNELDLHWHPLFEAHNSISSNDFWDSSVSLEVAGVDTQTFCITDNFFHTIVHGLRYNPEPPIRWVADSITILNLKDSTIDWDRLLHYTKKFRVVLQMRDALEYLIEKFQAPVPTTFLDDLKKIKLTFTDRLVFRHAKKYGDKVPVTFYEKIYTIYAGYLRQSDEIGLWPQHIGFIKYMRFRTKGKPYLRIMIYYLTTLFKHRQVLNKNKI